MTTVFSSPLFENKTMYIPLRINFMILRAISRGLRGGSNLLVVFLNNCYESDLWSTTQVETSLVENYLVGVYGERVLESPRGATFVLAVYIYVDRYIIKKVYIYISHLSLFIPIISLSFHLLHLRPQRWWRSPQQLRWPVEAATQPWVVADHDE